MVEKCFQSGKYELIEKKSYPFPRYVINVRVLFILHIKIPIIFIYLRLNILLSMRLVLTMLEIQQPVTTGAVLNCGSIPSKSS